MQFIYLGEVTFFEERIKEFIAVAQSLEIKELYNAETKKIDDDDKPSPSNPLTSPDNSGEQTLRSRQKHIESIHEGFKYGCDQCDYQATQQINLKRHIESKHEGVKYACDQCDYQASRKDKLKVHIELKHEGF